MDDQTFKVFYETHAKPLWAYVYRLTKDKDLSDEIVQESFVRILSRDLSSLTDVQRKAYVYQTATNIFKDHLRKNKSLISWENGTDSALAQLPNTADKMDFEMAFDRLSTQHRSLLWMAYAENYSHEEIAAILKIKTTSVKVLLFRAKIKMIEILKELGITEG